MTVSGSEVYRVNPLKRARQNLGMSQAQLASKAQVSPQAILKYEQGLYQEPSKAILLALWNVAEDKDVVLSLAALTKDYHEWRIIHQAAQRWLFCPLRGLSIRAGQHPFTSLRLAVGEGYSQQGFAVLLAVHPATLQAYDGGRQRHMPSVIRDALANAGCRKNIIDEVDSFGALYYDSMTHED
jgi:transcriptional regulator with XRE-family HTH domain